MTDLIAALKRCIDDDGHMHLDRDQTLYLMFLLYDVQDAGPDVKMCDLQFAILDLMGVLPGEREKDWEREGA